MVNAERALPSEPTACTGRIIWAAVAALSRRVPIGSTSGDRRSTPAARLAAHSAVSRALPRRLLVAECGHEFGHADVFLVEQRPPTQLQP
jgi:hypothetical protein